MKCLQFPLNISLSRRLSDRTFKWQDMGSNWRAVRVDNLLMTNLDVGAIDYFSVEVGVPKRNYQGNVLPSFASMSAANAANLAGEYMTLMRHVVRP